MSGLLVAFAKISRSFTSRSINPKCVQSQNRKAKAKNKQTRGINSKESTRKRIEASPRLSPKTKRKDI
jgi:hypothetical protein